MTTLTGRNTRTITGYVVTLLDYPRWVIERAVDFTDCHLDGAFDAGDAHCSTCPFGAACCWLNANHGKPFRAAPLEELLQALKTSVNFLRESRDEEANHATDCRCDTCQWLHEAQGFLRQHRHRS